MRRGALIWGLILVVIGALLLFDEFLPINVWELAWPIILILIGVWILLGIVYRPKGEYDHAKIQMEGTTRARIRINHGAGRLRIHSMSNPEDLIEGDFQGGVEYDTSRHGDEMDVSLRVPSNFLFFAPWFWGRGGMDWSFGINNTVALSLSLNTGAADAELDLRDLHVNEVRLQTGASSTVMMLPANAGQTNVSVEAGAASVRLVIPDGVAARIRNRSGLSSLSVDRSRFQRKGDVYQSEDYDSATNRVDVNIQTGVGSVEVR